MASRVVKVGSAQGLHARPATLISQAAAEAGSAITLGRPGSEGVDAASVLLLMTLGIGNGEEVEIVTDDEALLEKIVELVETDLDAEDA